MVLKKVLLMIFLSVPALSDTGFTNTIRVTETDNSPACTIGQLKVSAGSLTCSGQTATIVTGSSGSSGIVSPGTFTWTNASGINVSTIVVQAPSTTAYEAKFSTATALYHVAISTNGHLLSQGSTPSISSCGSTPNGSVVGNDIAGVITIGGGVSVTSCLLTFVTPYETNAPVCMANDNANILFVDAVTTTSTLTIRSTVNFAGDTVSYLCVGRQ